VLPNEFTRQAPQFSADAKPNALMGTPYMQKVILKGYILVPESDLVGVMEELPVHIDLTGNETGLDA
jgi:hypothetical protein